MTAPLFESIRASLFRFCKDFNPDLTLYDFDAYAVTGKLPDGDLIGLHQLSIDVESKIAKVRTMIGLTTDSQDVSLKRLNTLAGQLLDLCLPEALITLYDAEDGSQIGHMKVTDGTSLSPALNAQQRPLKLLSLTAIADRPFG